MRYIGGKSLLLNNIEMVIKQNDKHVDSFIDLFSGSGVVGQYFKSQGYSVISNDLLYFSYAIARGTVGVNYEPKFNLLNNQFNIQNPIEYLNDLTFEKTDFLLDKCFVYNNYSPAGSCNRMYFQSKNALKIDLIRIQIEEWYQNGCLNEDEYFYLLAALLNAVPYVANITGTFGSYLKHWDKRSFNDLILVKPCLTLTTKICKCFNFDYHEVIEYNADVLYADPPYNERDYLSNYHVMETIARYDYPEIKGVTGIRYWKSQKSIFCKKASVESAFESLIKNAKSKYLLISYNNEGLISTEKLSEICQSYALDDSFQLYEFDYRRYKNKIPNNKSGLKEQLYYFKRN